MTATSPDVSSSSRTLGDGVVGVGPRPTDSRIRAEAIIDLDAISANTAALRAHAGGRDLMAVVKADAYGHGMIPAARAARAGGAGWLGVALLEEALRLRASGDTGPVLSWLAVPGESYDVAIAAGIDVTAYSRWQLEEIIAAAKGTGRRASIQLKLDTGLNRGGAHRDAWPMLVEATLAARDAGYVTVTGIWSHFACSDEPAHPFVASQLAAYDAGVRYAVDAGLEVQHLHLANSGGLLAIPDSWHTMVRPGIALYGISPFVDGSSPVPLRPAMRLHARVALVKRVGAGEGVSYGHAYVTKRETTLALVPLGYGDGVPRHASGRGPVWINGATFPVAGSVCMDQVVLDIGDHAVAAGDLAVLIGDASRGEPTARDWADASDTISYEIVTRLGSRVPRRFVGELA